MNNLLLVFLHPYEDTIGRLKYCIFDLPQFKEQLKKDLSDKSFLYYSNPCKFAYLNDFSEFKSLKCLTIEEYISFFDDLEFTREQLEKNL